MTAVRSISAALFGLVLACGGESPKPESVATPVFLISIDTLRSDRLPSYGYEKGVTPAIDALRRDSVLFERAFTPCPLTLPAHASLFTGVLPPSHGIRDNAGYLLSSDAVTLASHFKQRGYETGAAVSSYILRQGSGIERGFDFYDDAMEAGTGADLTSVERDGSRTADRLKQWLSGQSSRQNIFGFLHLYEPHSPYAAPPAYQRDDAYDGEVSYADSIVGSFLEFLKQRDMYDSALIVLVSDHGEALGGHGEDEHGIFLYRETLQVPLLIKLPRQKRSGEAIREPVSLTDVATSILAVASGDTKPGGELLSPAPNRPLYAETYFPRLHLGWSESFSLILGTDHYIEAPRSELYDLSLDPDERKNLIDDRRRIAFAMKAALDRIDRRFGAPGTVDPEQARKLAALGYIGTTAVADGALPDAKDHISSLRLLKGAVAARLAGQHQKAVELLNELTRLEPQMIDGWALKADSLRKLGRNREALRVLSDATRRFPSRSDLLLRLSDALLESGDVVAAQEKAEAALKLDEPGAREALARIAMHSGNAASAESELRKVLAREPDRISALLLLSQSLAQQRRFADALAILDHAAAQLRSSNGHVAGLQRRRGESLLELRRAADAESAFRSEIAQFPGDLDAWGELAITLAAMQRDDEARSVLAELVRRHPTAEAKKLAGQTLQVIEAARRQR